MYYGLAISGVMLALTVVAAFLIGGWAMILAGASVIVMIISFFIPHRTREGETRAKQWEALKRYLKAYEFRSGDHREFLAQISDYLVYGVVLGLSSKSRPRMKFPPPTTIATSTPKSTKPWSLARMPATASVLTPFPPGPDMASPDILRQMRLYRGFLAILSGKECCASAGASQPPTE